MLNGDNTISVGPPGAAPSDADSRADTCAVNGQTAKGGVAAPRCWSAGSPPLGSSPRSQARVLAKAPCAQAVPRIGALPGRPRPAQFRLEFDDGTSVAVGGRGLIGRDPAAAAGAGVEHLVRVVDETLSMSRTHLEFSIDECGMWIRDMFSTNGSATDHDGDRTALEPGTRVRAPAGCTIHLGACRVRVRTVSGRAVVGPATLDWGVATHVGAARLKNQDAYCTESPVFVVADGMGGHSDGDLASREVVESLATLHGCLEVTRDLLMGCLAAARERIGRILVHGGGAPGTTLSGVIVSRADDGPCWMVVNVGDSRTYRLDSDEFRQVSTDHSVAQELIDAGVVTSSAAATVRYGNCLTRAILAGIDQRPDVWRLPMMIGDRILVCSDGLTRMLDDATIAGVLRAVREPLAAADELVSTVVDAGGHDDVTALVVDAVAVRAA
jgi:serine/threonine protein phosphatase PrpC